jgi:hypothetical protein
LPPPPAPPSPRAAPFPGISAAFVVLVLAFLLAFLPVRNSDFWLHLAAGRNLLEHGDASASYLEGTPWVNHSWLYQVVLYEAYSYLGETSLIVLKACLAAILGLLLLLAGRVERTFWLPAAATMLTLVAMGPWLAFRPVLVSYLGFAGTIYILRRWENGADHIKSIVALAVLFALWVNLDGWFILGCLLVGCWCLGQFLRRENDSAIPGRARRLAALLFLGCLAPCLLNPNHVLAFLPRGEWLFSGVSQNLRPDSLLRAEFLDPAQGTYLSRRFFQTGPGLAYWLLVFAGLWSFWLSRKTKTLSSRGIVWGVFLVLSFLQTQLIPFFAMVSGVTLALNVGGWLAAGRSVTSGLGGLAFLAKGGLLVTGLALAAGAWIGLFQSNIREPRSGTIDADPALEHLAGQLQEWRQQGRLGNGNGFHLTPEAANQLAWFCPAEKGFLNSHLRVSPLQAAEYVAVRKGLSALPGSEATTWRNILRAHNINHVVIYSSHDAAEVEKAVRNLIRTPREWPLLYLREGAAIFGWRDPIVNQATKKASAVDVFTGLEKNLDQLAFSSQHAREITSTGPEGEPQRFYWWQAFWKPRPFRAPDLREAQLAMAVYEALIPVQISRNGMLWNVCSKAGLVAEQCSAVGFSLMPFTGADHGNLFFASQDEGPPAALYLAIRAARRALDNNPDEPSAYLTLGEAYFQLNRTTREHFWAATFPGLGKIRTVQAIAAYQNALRLNWNLPLAHDRLATLYISMEYKDLALKHLREYLRSARRQGPYPGETRDGMNKRLAVTEGILQNLSRDVEQLTLRFESNSPNLRVLDRAILAGRLGLAGKALDILLDSDVSAFDTNGMDLELKLLLQTGQVAKARKWMDEALSQPVEAEKDKVLEIDKVLPAYRWNKIQLHASIGNYTQAESELEPHKPLRVLNREMTLHSAAALMYANGVLAAHWRGGPFQMLPLKVFVATRALPMHTYRLLPDEDEIVFGQWLVAKDLARRARFDVLRGLLALEAGRIADAEVRFRKGLEVLNSLPFMPFDAAETARARTIAEHFLQVIRAASGEAGRRRAPADSQACANSRWLGLAS